MNDERSQRIDEAVGRLSDRTAGLSRIQAICHACVEVLPITGSGIMLMAERVHQGTLYATDGRTLRLEELQNAAAEGPCIDSYNLGRPMLEPDLAGNGMTVWPLLTAAALQAGVRALFSFPLQIDDAAVGALNLYRDDPVALTHEHIDDARLLAAMATREVLRMQAEAPPESLPAQIADLSGDRAAIEQATGMVAAQLNTTVVEGARQLRNAAAERQRPLAEIAHEVVARKLRLD